MAPTFEVDTTPLAPEIGAAFAKLSLAGRGAMVVVVVGATVVVVVRTTVVVVVGATVVVVVGGTVVVGATVVVDGTTAVVVGATTVVVGDGASVEPTYKSLLGEPTPGSVTTPVVADTRICEATCAGVIDGLTERTMAAAPATCGAAIDVPLRVRMMVSPVCDAEAMPTPGAKRSRHEPQFEKEARASFDPVAPTVSALGSLAGDALQASAFELPAATTNTTPSATPRAMAAFKMVDFAPPKLRLATAGWPAA